MLIEINDETEVEFDPEAMAMVLRRHLTNDPRFLRELREQQLVKARAQSGMYGRYAQRRRAQTAQFQRVF